MRRSLILCLILVAVLGCKAKKTENFSLENILKDSFTQTEITELKEILSFFDNSIRDQTKISLTDSAYRSYMNDLRHSDIIDFNNKFLRDSARIDSFINTFNKTEIFNKIWKYDYFLDQFDCDTLAYQLMPDLQGKYMILLNKAIDMDTVFIEYKNYLQQYGTFPAIIIFGFQNNYNRFDFNNELIRLIVAIHYISLKSYTPIKTDKDLHNN